MNYIRNEKAIQLLGKRIRTLRKLQNLSQSQLAFEAGIARNQVVNIELGKVNTSISSVFAIAEALHIPVQELFDFSY